MNYKHTTNLLKLLCKRRDVAVVLNVINFFISVLFCKYVFLASDAFQIHTKYIVRVSTRPTSKFDKFRCLQCMPYKWVSYCGDCKNWYSSMCWHKINRTAAT